VQAGLTPYQALVAATRNPAEFLNQTSEWGTIESGKRADFVLVSANPLVDIRNTLGIEGVSVAGKPHAAEHGDVGVAHAAGALP
jgi:imidazolonepropionase-like amidohydrolase